MTILPDILEPGMRVAFCGTAVGTRSAQVRAYYAGQGNQFWDILSRTGLTPHKLDPDEYHTLNKYGIGLTDLVKKRSGGDSDISSSDFDVTRFSSKIEKFAPKALAFNGKRAGKEFFRQSHVNYGRQDKTIGRTNIFVLPSTSGAARRYWEESYWYELANFVNK
ncbi:mismatch-specific DNA-glycosylase [Nitrospinae bacterium AH_259_B05_G02_I21]|nr:mismatch-specific DNA-glycosylase [Nitrospinae bacterium AH_259_B05_G02_I21]MDA2932460.1 mismatch-specific DNA-glycosylase [Nitrospinae bacterium AH-259-F20]